MNKKEFLEQLSKQLTGLSKKEREERLAFYSEMIDDRMEEGLSEAEAVESVTTEETVFADTQTEAVPPKRRRNAWMIVLLVLGSPIWLSLLISAFAVVLSVYVSIWAGIISLWAGFASIAASGVGGILGGIGCVVCGYVTSGIALIGAGIACVGLSIFAFYGCRWLTVATALLTKKTVLGIKHKFSKKENAQ